MAVPRVQFRDFACVLNGNRIEGLVEDRRALAVPNIGRLQTEFSAEGFSLQTLSGQKGGNVTFTLIANAPSLGLFMSWHTSMQKDIIVPISGSITNSRLGSSVALNRGALMSGPPFWSYGAGNAAPLTFTLFFEEIIGDFSGWRANA